MTPDAFRRLALKLPETVESAHMGHPDFRVKGRIFASLFSRAGIEFGMVKLPLDAQKALCREHPGIFQPLAGAWGRQGCTSIHLAAVKRTTVPIVRGALLGAWQKSAPKSLVAGTLS